jgi:anaerobic selenocysteine-containing dehydrogenase
VADFYPWPSQEAMLDAILDHPATGHATIAALRASGGIRRLNVSEVDYPTRRLQTPSGKVEFRSERAAALGLPSLPDYLPQEPSDYPLTRCHGRTLTRFHAFYDHGRALPTLAARDSHAELWMSPDDAALGSIPDGTMVRVHNDRSAV